MIRRPPRSTLFPTRRSSDLPHPQAGLVPGGHEMLQEPPPGHLVEQLLPAAAPSPSPPKRPPSSSKKDRKSTRLNSSHANISYAVFCLKKKIKTLLLSY